jgi:hypothetical protein
VSHLVYPRLPLSIARARIDILANAYVSGGINEVEKLVDFEHPRAAPVATGGRIADRRHIELVRERVIQAVDSWRKEGEIGRLEVSAFDLSLGRALYDALEIIPADAAHDETWNFLTLIVLPDVAVLRFPGMHPDRMLGTDRNALRRPWLRREILGDLTDRYERPLGEDEMVGLFERSAMARNRLLIRVLAEAVMEYSGSESRSYWARNVYKRVRYSTGPRALDALTELELKALIRSDERPSPVSVPAVDYKVGAQPESRTTTSAQEPTPAVDTGWPGHIAQVEAPSIATHGVAAETRQAALETDDLEIRFHRAMVDLYQRAKRELGYNATYLLRMISQEGGLVTARRLVMAEHASEGFDYLWEHGRLDLSVEALVLDPQFKGLFDAALLERAEQRLAELH